MTNIHENIIYCNSASRRLASCHNSFALWMSGTKNEKKLSIKVEQVLEKRKAQLTPKNTLLYNFFSSLAVFQFLWHFVMPTSKITFLSSRSNFVPFQGRALFFYCWKRNLLISRSMHRQRQPSLLVKKRMVDLESKINLFKLKIYPIFFLTNWFLNGKGINLSNLMYILRKKNSLLRFILLRRVQSFTERNCHTVVTYKGYFMVTRY